MEKLYGGSLSDYADSMAQEIEKALDEVRSEAGLPPLPSPADADPTDLQNRRVLFIAIARGLIRHLQTKNEAFEIKVSVANHPTVTTHPDIKVKEPPP